MRVWSNGPDGYSFLGLLPVPENQQARKLATWDAFCREHKVLERPIPLFATNGNTVPTLPRGNSGLPILARSPEMEALVISETEKVLQDYNTGAGDYEGLIYMMLWPEGDRALPLYIGKSEKYGRGGGNLSANISDIRRNRHKFCRWGDGYAYHVGDLSAVVCPGHPEGRASTKYRRWANSSMAVCYKLDPTRG